MSSMEAKIEILWNSLLLTWSYDYRIAGIHTFDKDGLAIGENLIERLNLETSWGTLTILETTDTSITFIHNGTRIILSDGAKYHFEVPQVLPGSQGDFYIELICSQVRLTHWDEFFECSRQFTVRIAHSRGNDQRSCYFFNYAFTHCRIYRRTITGVARNYRRIYGRC